jgi:hypothetical protein
MNFGKRRCSKPKIKATAPLGLNAVGKLYGANYDPNYKMNFGYTKIGRLYAPYGSSMRFVGDQSTTDKRRRRGRRPQPAPLLDRAEAD